jgi:hypothetical protein
MDVIDVLPKSHDLTPFIVASAEFGEKSVPAWMEVVPVTDAHHRSRRTSSFSDRYSGSRTANR